MSCDAGANTSEHVDKGFGLHADLHHHCADCLSEIISHEAYKFKKLNEYHQNMVRQVRAILKEEGDLLDHLHRSRRRARREEPLQGLG